MTSSIWDMIPHILVHQVSYSQVVHTNTTACATGRLMLQSRSSALVPRTLREVLQDDQRPGACYQACQDGDVTGMLDALYATLHRLDELQKARRDGDARDVAGGILNGRAQLGSKKDWVTIHHSPNVRSNLREVGTLAWTQLETETQMALEALREPDNQADLIKRSITSAYDQDDLWLLARPGGRQQEYVYADVLFEALSTRGGKNEMVVAPRAVIDRITRGASPDQDAARWQKVQAPVALDTELLDTILGLYQGGGAGPLADLQNVTEAAASVLC